MGKLWQVKLGSMMVLDNFWPVISGFSVSIKGYVALQLLVSLCVSWLFGAVAYYAVLKEHNAFTAFVKIAFVCLGTAALTENFKKFIFWKQ